MAAANVFVFGATSAIAQATARLFAPAGGHFFLVARDAAKLKTVADDLIVRGAVSAATAVCAAGDFARHASIVEAAFRRLGRIDFALVAHGTLPDQEACSVSVDCLIEAFETNALSVMSLLTHLAGRFENQRSGTIGAIASVAGDRGRQSNYVYGAAKGAVAVYLQGLRNRLQPSGVRVLTVKPGFVDTPMTARFAKSLLWTTPERVARGIHDAVGNGRDVVYLPWFWRPIMRVLREIPEVFFKRMGL